MTPRFRLALAVPAALALGACVTERITPSRGVPLRASPANQTARPSRSAQGTEANAGLPAGTVAAPATGASSVNSSVTVAIQLLGSVPSDGLVLPLISPDGRFLAVERGEPPTWPTLLAQPGAERPASLTIEIYDLTHSPPRRIEPAAPLPPGLVLGRSGTPRDFLVESLAADGSRGVGRVRWVSGSLEWIAMDDSRSVVSACIERDGNAGISACSARSVTDTEAVLHVSISGAERELSEPSSSFAFPMLAIGATHVFAFQQCPAGTDLLAISTTGDRVGQVTARRNLSSSRDPWLAYQAAVAVQAAPPVDRAAQPNAADRLLLFFHPGAGRMCLFDPADASVLPLETRSIAGCWARDAAGPILLLTTPRGLVAQRLALADNHWTVGPPVRLLAESWVPRSTTDPDRPVILIGPGRGSDAGSVTLAAIKFIPSERAP